MKTIERYPKDCLFKYPDGWYITFFDNSANMRRQVAGPYKSKNDSMLDREVLNKKK